MEKIYPCPACGFLVYQSESGGYEICPICDWEDDPVQLIHPRLMGGANGNCLYEVQIQILAKIPEHIREYKGFTRMENWRPLNIDELSNINIPENGREYFDAIPDGVAPYYWEREIE